jgi:hypothetical protein
LLGTLDVYTLRSEVCSPPLADDREARLRRKESSLIGESLCSASGFFSSLVSLDTEKLWFPALNPLGLQQVQGEEKFNVEPLAADAATHWEFEERELGNVCQSHPRCSEFGRTAMGAIHIELDSLIVKLRISSFGDFSLDL